MTVRLRAAAAPRLALGLAAAVLAFGLASVPAAAAATAAVTIDNFTFSPETLTVPAGATVTWTNQDDIPHLVMENDGKFRSKALDTGDTFSEVFATPGTVTYYCAIHPHMKGMIVVTP